MAEIEVVEVGVETLRDAPLRVEHERADEATGAQPRGGEQLRKDDVFLSEVEAAVVAHPVRRRELAGEDRGVGGKRQRRDRHGLLEQHSLAGQAIEAGSLDVGESVAAEAIGPGGVQSDQEEAQIARLHPTGQLPQSGARGRDHRGAGEGPQPVRCCRDEQGDDGHEEGQLTDTARARHGNGSSLARLETGRGHSLPPFIDRRLV